MRDFFKVWQRKAGCFTLVLACFMTAALVRGLFVTDTISYDIPVRNCSWDVRSGGGECTVSYDWVDKGRLQRLPGLVWTTDKTDGARPKGIRTISVSKGWWFLGNQRIERHSISLGYWLVVIPLTLLSAYLLLSKPRPAKPPAEQPT